jgi:hypothetical protein
MYTSEALSVLSWGRSILRYAITLEQLTSNESWQRQRLVSLVTKYQTDITIENSRVAVGKWLYFVHSISLPVSLITNVIEWRSSIWYPHNDQSAIFLAGLPYRLRISTTIEVTALLATTNVLPIIASSTIFLTLCQVPGIRSESRCRCGQCDSSHQRCKNKWRKLHGKLIRPKVMRVGRGLVCQLVESLVQTVVSINEKVLSFQDVRNSSSKIRGRRFCRLEESMCFGLRYWRKLSDID